MKGEVYEKFQQNQQRTSFHAGSAAGNCDLSDIAYRPREGYEKRSRAVYERIPCGRRGWKVIPEEYRDDYAGYVKKIEPEVRRYFAEDGAYEYYIENNIHEQYRKKISISHAVFSFRTSMIPDITTACCRCVFSSASAVKRIRTRQSSNRFAIPTVFRSKE